ncbi:hypothetical protein EYE40_15275 [Glaciihabitans arcticus]|uniref:Uncharacterized protein n=1 Tax=Glaciihabitans arcticus TaxID=2668039 RepID=A0A4Q9GMJ4_9MICO|nr:hypothetical protein [Glaciihabitans arcticus]TBN55558.1 hypothetical protein EYE40_15275 [Glaciihabitans arcticus]
MTIAPGTAGGPALAEAPADEGQRRLGWSVGQPMLFETWGVPADSSKRSLSTGESVLPELAEDKAVAKSFFRHPAFIVSISTTIVAVVVGVVMTVMGVLGDGPAKVSDLAITGGEGNVHLTWTGPDVPFSLYVIEPGSDEVLDVSQLVRKGSEAWVPKFADLITDDSCFVVRAAETSGDVTLDPSNLESQGAASVCVADATDATDAPE